MSQKENLTIGGQAVLEGVMLRCKNKISLAVRKPDGEIHVEVKDVKGLNTSKIFQVPFIRGAANLVEAMKLGVQILTQSANISEGEEGEQLTKKEVFFSVFFAIAAAIGLFFVAPTLLVELLEWIFGTEFRLRNLAEGIIRLTIFLVYILAISRIKEIYRVFQYHGAEHMVVHCYEQKHKLTIENVSKYSPLHKRCGTSFMLLVMVISVVIFSMLPWMPLLPRIIMRILIVPLIAGVAYEVTRFAGKSKSPLINLMVMPGLSLQKLTTKIPDSSQIEVAVAAINGILNEDNEQIDNKNREIYNVNEIACKEEV